MKLSTALRHFSHYIRLRDAAYSGICKCCTCTKKDHWKNMDAGHFVKRRATILLLDEMNCYAQCVECNRLRDGEPDKMALYIDRVHGPGTADELIRKGHQFNRLFPFEVEEKGIYYREKAKELLKRVAA